MGLGMMVKLLGYAPDASPDILGVLTNCSNMIPTLKGMKGAPTPQATGTTVFHATCHGAAVALKLDNTTRFFAGSNSVLSELTDVNTWTSRGTGYSLAEDDRWRFAVFGDTVLASNKQNTIQASASSAFADVAGAPKAAIIETVGQFVFAFNTTDGTYGDSPHRWWCSALGNHASWTPSVASQAATGILTSSPGKIVAGKRFGESIIAFKNSAMYRGDYVGPPIIWSFSQIPGEVGALCQEAVASVGTPDAPRLMFMGPYDFYSYDGSRPIPIGESWVKELVYSELLRSKQEQVIAQHDKSTSNVYFYYPTTDSPNPDKCVVYNYRTGKWGRSDRQIEAAVEYIIPGMTYAEVGNFYATYGQLPLAPYGTAFWADDFPTPAIFDTSHNLRTMTGPTESSSMTTGDFGNDQLFSFLQRVKCRYIISPTSASMVNYYRNNLGDSLTQDVITAESGGKFDVLREARWHRFRFDFVGSVEIPGIVPEMERAGGE